MLLVSGDVRGRIDVLDRAHLVVKEHGRQCEHAVAGAHDREVLLGADDEPAQRGAVGLTHDLQ